MVVYSLMLLDLFDGFVLCSCEVMVDMFCFCGWFGDDVDYGIYVCIIEVIVFRDVVVVVVLICDYFCVFMV